MPFFLSRYGSRSNLVVPYVPLLFFSFSVVVISCVQLDLLKGDRFLGDADWEMVWRYIPVSTSKMYWHRIRYVLFFLPVYSGASLQYLHLPHLF